MEQWNGKRTSPPAQTAEAANVWSRRIRPSESARSPGGLGFVGDGVIAAIRTGITKSAPEPHNVKSHTMEDASPAGEQRYYDSMLYII
jgi:hypothetical protein